MSLTYNKKLGCYSVVTHDTALAERCGLTKSTTARGVDGETVYYTADSAMNPTDNPYAVMPFYEEGDSLVKQRMAGIKRDFDMSWKTDDEFVPASPDGLEYRGFQKAGVKYGVDKRDVLIGDEPGLGKTIQAVGIANEIQADKVLIIVPASIRLNWHREYLKWTTNPDAIAQAISSSKGGPDYNKANVIILSYELAKSPGLHAGLLEQKWDLLILDEAHYLKSTDASRTQAIFGGGNGLFKDNFIAKNVESIVALTGTPLPNRPRECYTLARALCHESIDWLSFEKFCYRYNPSGVMENGHKLELKGREPELQARLRSNFMIRRLKKDVLKDLPDKQYEFTYMETNGAIQEVLRRESLLSFKLSDLHDPFGDLFGMIATLRREMGEAKASGIVAHMRYLLDIEEIPKVVLFCHHNSVMDQMMIELEDYGIVAVRGGMGMKQKDKSVQAFRFNPKVRVFLGQMEAAGFGIDGLQDVCDHVVIAEPAWTPGTNEQAIDRCHRIGQHNNVLAQFLVVEGSLDERVLAAVLEKNETIHNVLDRSH